MAVVEHKDITGANAIHPIMYIQSGDPGAVGAAKFWLDTTAGASLEAGAILKKRNAGDSGWDTIVNGASYVAKTAVPCVIGFAVSDETTAITQGTAKLTVRMPHAMTLTGVRASLKTAATTGTFTVDINENGTTILSTKITIDATEKTSTTAATPPVISDASLADDAEITIDIDDDASGDAVGLKVWLIGTRSV